MQSSPPQRAHQAPPSPATSNYSINLDALELDSQSGASTPLPTQQTERVLTSDIDGPSDFTLNMEKWMRGGTLRKGSQLGSMRSRRTEGGETAKGGDAARVEEVNEEEEGRASAHTPSNSPPKQLVLGEDDGGRDEDDRSDGSNPYWEADTPRTAQRDEPNGRLQPTVEEYHSELTPAKFTYSTSRAHSKQQEGVDVFESQLHREHDAPQSETEPLSPLNSPPLSPISQRSALNRFEPDSQARNSEQELEHLRAKCTQLEVLNRELQNTLLTQRQERQQDRNAHASQIAEFERRERDLTDMKTQSQQHSSDFRREFSELKERLASYELSHAEHKAELDRSKTARAAEIQDLQSKLERQKQEYEEDAQAYEQDLELARRSCEDAEEVARNVKDELGQRENEVEKLKAEILQGEELREGIKEQLRAAMMEKERLAGSVREMEGAASARVDALRQEYERVTKDLRAQLGELKTELERERARSPSPSPPAAEAEAEAVEDKFRADYNDAIIERDALQDEVSALRAELAAAKEARETDRAAAAVVGEAFNGRIAEAIRTREQYWRHRISAAKEERKVMAKALLRAWGREKMGSLPTPPSEAEDELEWAHRVGAGEQAYRYMFGGRRKDDVEVGEVEVDRKGEDVIEVLEILDRERLREKKRDMGDRRVVLDLP